MPTRPNVYTVPLHRGFADALAAGLLARADGDPLALARGLVLLPNNRAARAVHDAFVRRADGGLLLPRLVSVGDPALDEAIGAALDPPDGADIPPAIDPLHRQLVLARLVAEARAAAGDPVAAAEALRLAADLGRVLDQLLVEEVVPARLAEAVPAELAEHWQATLASLRLILARWPAELARLGRIDLADRRNRLIDATARAWRERPPPGFVVAAGIDAAGPALGRLLARVARLERGMVVLAGLDLAMPDDQWAALAPGDGAEGQTSARPLETHPQFALHRLLDRIGVARQEVRRWPRGGVGRTPAARSGAIGHVFTAAAFTDRWQALTPRQRRLTGVRAVELATPAAEAQAIALALREAVETPGRTAALVTPDRALAARVAAHLGRWGIAADDSAGRPLSLTPPGTLLLAMAEALAEDFAPVPLLALLKHPLVQSGDARGAWLDGARQLDRALRGPRPAPGLAGLDRQLAAHPTARAWFDSDVRARLAPLAGLAEDAGLGAILAALREAAATLTGEATWARPAGRATADLFVRLESVADEGPRAIARATLPALLRGLLDAVAVRPPPGSGHPRLFIWGLIEARLQQPDLVILAGLNEGVWPAAPAPDPWLAPAIRRALGLPGLERRIGVEAHEFASALGAPEVLLTRARRDARAPAVASRFWLRLEAVTGGTPRHPALARWAARLDTPATVLPVRRPEPSPPIADRPRRIAVTKLDRLKADPYAFYADRMLRLRRWDAVDADPSPAWRGSAVHAVFERWIKEDDCAPAALRLRAEAMLAEVAAHPVVRTLWSPRLLEAIEWVAATMAADGATGRRALAAEVKGETAIAGIVLEGTADRIDRLADGRLAIVDYKTGRPPSRRAVTEGYALQLGLLGLIAERGGFGAVAPAQVAAWEYWSLARGRDGTLGYRETPVDTKGKGGIAPEDFSTRAARMLTHAVETWLTGDAPFTARLHPEYAPYADYDQLMRLDEWYGRGPTAGDAP